MTELLHNISAATLSQKGTDQEISHENTKLVFWWSGHNRQGDMLTDNYKSLKEEELLL